MIAQPENCKLMNPRSNMSSTEEPLLPLFQRNQKYSSSKQDRSKSCDLPNRCAPSFHPDTNVKASLSTLNQPPATNENTNIVSTPTLQRVHSSPSIFTSIKEAPCAHELDKQSPAAQYTPSITRQAISLYMTNVEGFKGKSTLKLVDAMYFTIISLCTIGYGDIVPCTTFTKVFTCLFLLIGVRLLTLSVLLSTMDDNKLNKVFDTYMIDAEKKRSRGKIKVLLALGVGLNWIDSFYLSVISVTTVGYGDYGFSTTAGSKSDFMIYKLKEMGKIDEKDVTMISDQFDQLGLAKCGNVVLLT
ncbi:hypothetical protein ZWY2020_057509 [Hordeum vulgare]|nr:hypothetical protein ZWY2020_057509 [Hordeum vulgare]